MPSVAANTDAALLGLASGMRTFIAPTTLAWRGRLVGTRGRSVLTALALGEMAADKYPAAPSRTEWRGLGGRVVASAVSGNAVAGPSGAALGLATGLASTFGCHRARAMIVGAGVSDPVVAVAEDLLAVAVATVATRRLEPA